MAGQRLSMRKTREILRQKWCLGRSHREVARSLGKSVGAISATLARATTAELDWEAVSALSDEALDGRLYGAAVGGGGRVLPELAAVHAEHTGEYRYSGPPVEPFAVAFETTVQIRPQALDRSPRPRERQLAHLEGVFASPGPEPAASETVFSWRRSQESGDWEEQYTWSEDAGRGRRRSSVEKTGSRFADCSLAIYGPLTEFACPDRRSTYAGDRHLGGNNDPTLGSVVRYAAEIDGTLAYFAIVDSNSVSYIRIVFRLNGEWHEDGVENDHTVC